MWQELGTVTLNDFDWHFVGPPIVYGLGFDIGVFRVTHDWNANMNPVGKAWMASYYEDDDTWALFKPLRPYKGSSRIISSPVPKQYLLAGMQERTIGIKAANRTRFYDGSNWTVTVEHYVPDTETEEEQFFAQLLELESGQDQIVERLRRIEERI